MSLAMAGKVLGNSTGFVTTARPGITVMCEIMVLKSHQSGLVARLSDTRRSRSDTRGQETG